MRPNVPDEVKPYVDWAIHLEGEGRYAEASAVYRQALARAPQLAVLHNNLGCCLANQHQYAAAEAAFRRAVTLTSTNRAAGMVTPASYPDEPAQNLRAVQTYLTDQRRWGRTGRAGELSRAGRRLWHYVRWLVTRRPPGRGLTGLIVLVLGIGWYQHAPHSPATVGLACGLFVRAASLAYGAAPRV